MIRDDHRIGIITPPIGGAGVGPLSNLIDVISYRSNLNFVVTGDVDLRLPRKYDSDILIYRIAYFPQANIIKKTVNHLCLQVKICCKLILLRNEADILIYFLDSHEYTLPVLIGKLLKKKTIFILAASISDSARANPNIFSKILQFSEFINFKLADFIIIYSSGLIEKWNLKKYTPKIFIAHEHFLSLDTFSVTTPLPCRTPIIGYVGRLSREKGILNFTQALPFLITEQTDIRVIIGGNGPLMDVIKASLTMHCITKKVDLPGWISHSDLPQYLNRMKLIVLPSYSEGLPNIMLEAMACGTPVLTTPVGAIPDIIEDGVTGFIMENNSPECIATNVLRALNSPDLAAIAKKGRQLVQNNYSFENTVSEWKKIVDSI